MDAEHQLIIYCIKKSHKRLPGDNSSSNVKCLPFHLKHTAHAQSNTKSRLERAAGQGQQPVLAQLSAGWRGAGAGP